MFVGRLLTELTGVSATRARQSISKRLPARSSAPSRRREAGSFRCPTERSFQGSLAITNYQTKRNKSHRKSFIVFRVEAGLPRAAQESRSKGNCEQSQAQNADDGSAGWEI